ncbi:energy transducer TonB [Alistipes sp. D31t1_170403_E11]|uniref:energy transducer TonB n=1 Tax=Alistipes sp. D31t1_170403_E11 TaxID=2787128 RepID=UPI001899B85B|nr:energy transducer TonB [Alistipes sp. D31t1_170403_E11]
MKRYVLILCALFCAATLRAATPKPQPLYIVNGKETKEIRSIPPEDIEHVEMLPADEETIACYGQRAAHGVMLITLRYDQPAAFPADSTFGSYIARQVRWDASEPTARVVLRYKITPEGEIVIQQELESTDNRLKRRVLKAVAEAPRWQPAQKNGSPIESEGVLSIQLPEGRHLPRQMELVIR